FRCYERQSCVALVGFQGLMLKCAFATLNLFIKSLKNNPFMEDAGPKNRVVRHGYIHDPGIQQEPSRLPATYNECGRLIADAIAHNTWEEVGVLAHTKPTKHRPVTSYKAYEGHVTLYGTLYRAVVVHSSAQDKRRQQRLARDIQAAQSTLQTAVRTAEQQ